MSSWNECRRLNLTSKKIDMSSNVILRQSKNFSFSALFQVINAARILAARPKSKVAQENMDVFRDAWINQVCSNLYPYPT